MKKSIAVIVLAIIGFASWPSSTYAASLYLTPSSGNIVVGDEFTVSVLTDTQGATVNTAESNITFTSGTLELLSVSQGSTFILPAPLRQINPPHRRILAGDWPNPGFSGTMEIWGP